MKQQNKKNEKGFTMIELIIVVAIMAIIGAVLVPMFGQMATKARLTSDITTVKTLQRQIDIYIADKGKVPDGLGDGNLASTTLKALVDANYIDAKDLMGTSSDYKLKLQTGGTVVVDDNKCKLQVTDSTYSDLITKVNADDSKDGNKGWVEAGPSSGTGGNTGGTGGNTGGTGN